MASLGDQLQKLRGRAQNGVRAAQIKGIAESLSRPDEIIVGRVGKPDARQNVAGGGILVADGEILLLKPDISRPLPGGAEAVGLVQLQSNEACDISGIVFFLQIELQGCECPDILGTGNDVTCGQSLQMLGDVKVGVEFVPPVKQVDVPVTR